jgi:3-isopropylmalate/(R)-2-methylmalate dehydratase small subunit
MSFEPIKLIASRVIPLRAENIDTDRIIPARFLKSVDTGGFGEKLFHDWRYRPDGTPDPGFILNQPEGRGQILLTGRNFGCGSSREHAAWALYQYGIRAVISSGFADIFRNNALNNGLMPVEVSESVLDQLFMIYQDNPGSEWMIDLERQVVTTSFTELITFEIDPFRKQCLMEGMDLTDFLVSLKPQIIRFEQERGIAG